ncbi:invasion associated locus B family protein [Labrys neptuniae]
MMSFRLLATAALAALSLAAAPALAQETPAKPAAPAAKPKAPAAKPAPKPAAAAPAAAAAEPVPTLEGAVTPAISSSQPDWVKLCQTDQAKKEICLTRRDLRSDTGQTMMTAILMQNVTDKRQILRLVMPVGALIQPGVALYLDNAAFTTGKYAVCSPEGCLVELPVDENQLKALRGSKTLAIAFKTPAQNVQLSLGTEGFAKALDNKPLDPQTIVDEQKKLQQQLQDAAEKARQQLNANPQ